MARKKEGFDAVEQMRSARKEISEKIQGMTLEEELRWLQSEELKDPLLQRLNKRTIGEKRAV